MDNLEFFTAIKLSTGESCEIYQLKPIHIWKANFKHASLVKEHEVNTIPFILEQIITINKKKTTWEVIGNMDYHDYMKIEEVANRMIVPLF